MKNRRFIGSPKPQSKVLQGAQHSLSLKYHHGEGVQQDDKKFYMWINLAIHNGIPSSRELRDALAITISSQDLIEAQEMAKRCLNSGYKDC